MSLPGSIRIPDLHTKAVIGATDSGEYAASEADATIRTEVSLDIKHGVRQLEWHMQRAWFFTEVEALPASQMSHPLTESGACLFRQLVAGSPQHFAPLSRLVAVFVEPKGPRTAARKIFPLPSG